MRHYFFILSFSITSSLGVLLGVVHRDVLTIDSAPCVLNILSLAHNNIITIRALLPFHSTFKFTNHVHFPIASMGNTNEIFVRTLENFGTTLLA